MALTEPVDAAGLRHRLISVYARIEAAAAAARAGRAPGAVKMLLATKTQAAATVRLAYDTLLELGMSGPRFGENRSREGRDKAAALDLPGAAWSMIGHVQSNKADEVLAFASEVQSLDRMSLAVALERRLQREGRSIDVLVQVKTAGESSKFGLAAADVPAFLTEMKALGALRVRGFMTLATNAADEGEVRRCFRALRDVQKRAVQVGPPDTGMSQLSMGMSGDFELAVEEGSTCVRLGQAVFGRRSFRPPGGWWAEKAASGA